MYYRRKILLNLVAACGREGVSRLRLQQLLFLFSLRQERPVFDFVPYKHGGFSFLADRDLDLLSGHYRLLEAKAAGRLCTRQSPYALKGQEQAWLWS